MKNDKFPSAEFGLPNNSPNGIDSHWNGGDTTDPNSSIAQEYERRKDSHSPIPTKSVVELMVQLGVWKGGRGDNNECLQTCDILLDGKYKIYKKIGSGSTGHVYKAKNMHDGYLSAIKVMKLKQYDGSSWKSELDIMNQILALDPSTEKSFCTRLQRSFTMSHHAFLVIDYLGPTLSKRLRTDASHGFPLKQMRSISYQLCSAVRFLHKNGIVHHDIKPGNIAFVFPLIETSPQIRLLDFGSATLALSGCRARMATTRQYRAPEVGFGLNWDATVDVWSVACTMFETLTGRRLFNTEDEEEKCWMLHLVIGPIPPKLAVASKLSCFDARGKLLKYKNPWGRKGHNKSPPMSLQKLASSMDDCGPISSLFDLLGNMLMVDPSVRLKSDEVFNHSFWEVQVDEESEEDCDCEYDR